MKNIIIASSYCEDLAKIFFEEKYNVYVISLYNSLRLKDYCKNIFITKNFSSINLNKIIKKIDPNFSMSILIGSGFVENLSTKPFFFKRKNYGNSPNVIKEIKSKSFFKFLDKKKINYPESTSHYPQKGKWLIKSFKSFGGNEVKIQKTTTNIKNHQYFQEYLEGKSISVQFFVKKKKVNILGVCDQILKSPDGHNFIGKTLISRKISPNFFRKILSIIKNISNFFSLNGINSVDLILKKANIFILEINPRPGLSSRIISSINKDFLNKDTSLKIINNAPYFSTTIIYAKKNILINKKKFSFLKKLSIFQEFSELPILGDIIKVDEPLCLVHLNSKNKNFLRSKIKSVQEKFLEQLDYI